MGADGQTNGKCADYREYSVAVENEVESVGSSNMEAGNFYGITTQHKNQHEQSCCRTGYNLR